MLNMLCTAQRASTRPWKCWRRSTSEVRLPAVLSPPTPLTIPLFAAETRLVVVHGAGSFGHFEAKEYGLAIGSQCDGGMPLRHRIGAALCRQAVTRLNHMVVSALIDKGVPAMGVSPFPTTTTYGSGVAEKDGSISHVQRLLERGYVPVVHGDFVFDQKRKFSILGGDAILERVCADLKPAPSRAVFVTDVAGIYDRPPGSPGEPRLLERIRVDPRTGRALDTFETSELGHDVTVTFSIPNPRFFPRPQLTCLFARNHRAASRPRSPLPRAS